MIPEANPEIVIEGRMRYLEIFGFAFFIWFQ